MKSVRQYEGKENVLNYSLQNVTAFVAQALKITNVFYLFRFVFMQISRGVLIPSASAPPLIFKKSR